MKYNVSSLSRLAVTDARLRNWSRLCGFATVFLCVGKPNALGAAPSVLFRKLIPSTDDIIEAERASIVVHFIMVVVVGDISTQDACRKLRKSDHSRARSRWGGWERKKIGDKSLYHLGWCWCIVLPGKYQESRKVAAQGWVENIRGLRT